MDICPRLWSFVARAITALPVRDRLLESQPPLWGVGSFYLSAHPNAVSLGFFGLVGFFFFQFIISIKSCHSSAAQLSIWQKIRGTPCRFLPWGSYPVQLPLSGNLPFSLPLGVSSTQRDQSFLFGLQFPVLGFQRTLGKKAACRPC